MANIVHHPHWQPLDSPTGLYWAAGIALGILALLLAYFSITSADHVGSVTPLATDPALPFVPFIPVL